MSPDQEEIRHPSKHLPPAVLILLAVAALCLVWLLALPGSGTRWRSDMLLLSTILVVLLGMIAAWGLLTARTQHTRVGKMEDERDLIFALSLDILCVMNAEGRFERTNPAFLNTLGIKPEELIGSTLLDLVLPDDLPIARERLLTLARGMPTSFELRCHCGDGSYRWLHWSANPLVKEQRIYAVAHDVTRRKASEDALRAEFAFRKAMEDSVLTGLGAIDMNGRIIYVNRAFSTLVGMKAIELIGQKPPFDFWAPEDYEANLRILQQGLAGKIPPDGLDMRVCQRKGKKLDVRLHLSELRDARGIQTGWMTAMTDVTESRRAHAQLEAAQERFIAVLDGLDAHVGVLDATTGELLYANRALARRNKERGSPSAQPLALPQPTVEEYAHRPEALDEQDIPLELFDGELQDLPSGRWYHLRERALRWVDGRIVRLVVATDISAIRHAEELAHEQEARLQATSRLITMGEMASSLAHELNQPLSAISNYSMGCVNRLKQGNFDRETLLEAMEKASNQAARAGQIVRGIREFVRKSEPRRALVSITTITDEALGIANIEAQRLGARVSTDIPDALPLVMADRIMVEQVLMNLVKNAAEAMLDTSPERRHIHVAARSSEGYIEVSVSDQGCGIHDEDLQKLFSPFFTTKPEGMGMGLNICRSIIEYHSGRLWVDTNPTGGSIFRFTLPQENALDYAPPN